MLFGVIPYGGENTHKQNPPKIPGQSRESVVFVFFSSLVFSLSSFPRAGRVGRGLFVFHTGNHHSCTRVRGPPVALHVSRYTCRSRFPQNPEAFRCGSSITLHPPPPPLKGPVAPDALELPGVSHVKLPLKKVSHYRGV